MVKTAALILLLALPLSGCGVSVASVTSMLKVTTWRVARAGSNQMATMPASGARSNSDNSGRLIAQTSLQPPGWLFRSGTARAR